MKPWNNQKLVETLLNAVSASETKSPANGPNAGRTAESSHLFADTRNMYWGNSPAMQQLRLLVEKVASTDANILITGENGTGKEMLAREIHSLSPRNRQEMVSVDMGAVTESLFESELFGHMKGSFTDAHADRAGKFEAASRSTLFSMKYAISLPSASQTADRHPTTQHCPCRQQHSHSRRHTADLRYKPQSARDGGKRRIPRGPAIPHQHDTS